MSEPVEVPLGQSGKVAVVDEADAHLIESWRFSWWKPRTLQANPRVLARRYGGGKTEQTWLNRIITGTVGNRTVRVKHKDGDTMNCRRDNLEVFGV